MPDAYLIEIDDLAVGLVAREEKGRHFRFHAAVSEAFPLDGRRFRTPEQARSAVRKLLRRASAKLLKELPRAA